MINKEEIMNKEERISEVIKDIYENEINLCISKSNIDKINDYYTKNRSKYQNFDSFLDSNSDIHSILLPFKESGIFCEIKKQFEKGKGLQPCILHECNLLLSLAKHYKLKSFFDIETTPAGDIPPICIDFVKSTKKALVGARYLYCNKSNSDIFILQYGNPKQHDASIVIKLNEILLEIKILPALLKDVTLTYNESGKILITKNMKNIPLYVHIINDFNNNNNYFDYVGRNYKLFENKNYGEYEEELKEFLKEYALPKYKVDILLTTLEDKIVAVRGQDIELDTLITIEGSEIRTAGKNKAKVFTKSYLNNILKSKEVEVRDNICYLHKSKILGFTNGRTLNEITRMNINNLFFVKKADVSEEGDYYVFSINSINQKKGGISIHINIDKSFNEVKEFIFSKI